MPNYQRQKGDRRERELVAILERLGASVTRSTGSLGDWDLIAIDKSLVSLIQVTSNAWKPPAVRQQLLDFIAPDTYTVAFVMVRFDDPRPKVDKKTGKRRTARGAAIRVLMATSADRHWNRVPYLETVFMETRIILNRERRNRHTADADGDCG